ncbi:MAG: hypothetical protein ABFS86_08380 [Planctomycetota bacterium]
MNRKKSGREISRRDFLRIFPGLAARRAEEIKDTIGEATGRRKKKAPKKPKPPPRDVEPRLPAFGETIDGIPNHHPWIATAHAIAAWMRRPRSYAWMLGATGEAFITAYSREDPAAALRHTPGNSFLASLAVTGIVARAAHGGPFAPAIGGVDVALGRDLVPVIATRDGPALIRDVDMDAELANWIRPGRERADVAFVDLEEHWGDGWWPGGGGAFLRVTLELAEDRDAARVTTPAIEAAAMLLSQAATSPLAMGSAAWEAFAEDLREGRLEGNAAETIVGELLPKLAVARVAAGTFLEEMAQAVPDTSREAILDAARKFREIHAPAGGGEVFGTGLLPEVAECVMEDQLVEPVKLEDPAYRERAADLLLEVRDRELEAADLIREAFHSS